MRWSAPLSIGTRVIAAKSFGPIIEGQLGIVTGVIRCGWWRTTYACTFLGGMKVAAPGAHITRHDHGCSWQMLEDPFWFLRTRQPIWRASWYAADTRRSQDWLFG